MHEKYMLLALNQARKAVENDEVPVGAVIIKDGIVLSKAFNKKESLGIATKHAEMIAIEKACAKLNDWRLDGCVLYVTMEPCLMCFGAVIESRIRTIVYGCPGNNLGNKLLYNKYNVDVVDNVCSEECKKIIKDFFVEKRNK